MIAVFGFFIFSESDSDLPDIDLFLLNVFLENNISSSGFNMWGNLSDECLRFLDGYDEYSIILHGSSLKTLSEVDGDVLKNEVNFIANQCYDWLLDNIDYFDSASLESLFYAYSSFIMVYDTPLSGAEAYTDDPNSYLFRKILNNWKYYNLDSYLLCKLRTMNHYVDGDPIPSFDLIKHCGKKFLKYLVSTGSPVNYIAPSYKQSDYFIGCSGDCSGHELGYQWAKENAVSSCGGNSKSFIEGCEAYLYELKDYEDSIR